MYDKCRYYLHKWKYINIEHNLLNQIVIVCKCIGSTIKCVCKEEPRNDSHYDKQNIWEVSDISCFKSYREYKPINKDCDYRLDKRPYNSKV